MENSLKEPVSSKSENSESDRRSNGLVKLSTQNPDVDKILDETEKKNSEEEVPTTVTSSSNELKDVQKGDVDLSKLSLNDPPNTNSCEQSIPNPEVSSVFGSGFFCNAVKQTLGVDCATSGFKWIRNTEESKSSEKVIATAPIFGQQASSTNDEEDDNSEEDSVDDNLFILPTIELPDLIEVKTGEEDEDIVYCQRAKLFKFEREPEKQWKERGIGDLKILKHQKVPNRYRIVLRREQVHKIACNHYLTTQMIFAPMSSSETSVCWFARDFADEEYADEQFAVKFKNKDILQVFTDKIKELQKLMSESTDL